MNRKERNKAKKILRRNLIAGTLLLFLLGLSIAGATGAWFNASSIDLNNIFTAGTVIVEAGDQQGELIIKNQSSECKIVELEITNTGSKWSYVRTKFAGAWKTAYHSNTAEVIAQYTIAGQTYTISSSDSAHYIDGNYSGQPLESLVGTITSDSWFTASDSTEQLLISPTFPSYSENSITTSNNVENGLLLTSATLLENYDAQSLGVQQLSLSNSSGPPTVDGRFYGGGDNLKYIPIGVSDRGSILYYYLDGTILYVAMVVNRDVNDNVFDVGKGQASHYLKSANWQQHRDFGRLTDSEDMEFSLNIYCDQSVTSWTWKQEYVDDNSLKYDSTDWSAGIKERISLPDNFDTIHESSSSMVWNMNNSLWASSGLIDQANDVNKQDWKSPFLEDFPDEISEVDGYPDDPNKPITYSKTFEWEWSMVYEYSVDLNGYIGNCSDYTISLSGGNAHHSPAKSGGEYETVDTYDWGDLPDGLQDLPSYPTLLANNGPRHKIVIGGAYLGVTPPDAELDGQPHPFALGDDLTGIDDEDGIELLTPLIPGYQAQFKVIAGTPGYLSAWIDFKESGSLTQINLVDIEGPQGVNINPKILEDYYLPAPGDYIITVDVPEDANGNVFTRWRYTNQINQGGNSITGAAETGEVEDHAFDITDNYPGIELKKYVSVDSGVTYFDADAMPGPVLKEGNVPIFKFVVRNTGTVDLQLNSLQDDVFNIIYQSDYDDPTILETGQSKEFYYPNAAGNWGDEDWRNYLIVEDGYVEVDFCDDVNNTGINDDWVKHRDGYFYYTKPIAPEGGHLKLCVKVCPVGISDLLKGFEFIDLKAYVESVQASNNAIYEVWFDGNDVPGIPFEPKP